MQRVSPLGHPCPFRLEGFKLLAFLGENLVLGNQGPEKEISCKALLKGHCGQLATRAQNCIGIQRTSYSEGPSWSEWGQVPCLASSEALSVRTCQHICIENSGNFKDKMLRPPGPQFLGDGFLSTLHKDPMSINPIRFCL